MLEIQGQSEMSDCDDPIAGTGDGCLYNARIMRMIQGGDGGCESTLDVGDTVWAYNITRCQGANAVPSTQRVIGVCLGSINPTGQAADDRSLFAFEYFPPADKPIRWGVAQTNWYEDSAAGGGTGTACARIPVEEYADCSGAGDPINSCRNKHCIS